MLKIILLKIRNSIVRIQLLIQKWAPIVLKVIKDNFKDILFMIGLFMLGKGLHMIYPPVMYLGIGLILIWIGFPITRKPKITRGPI